MKVKCPACGNIYNDVPDAYFGRELECSACHKNFIARIYSEKKSVPPPAADEKQPAAPGAQVVPLWKRLDTIFEAVTIGVLRFFGGGAIALGAALTFWGVIGRIIGEPEGWTYLVIGLYLFAAGTSSYFAYLVLVKLRQIVKNTEK